MFVCQGKRSIESGFPGNDGKTRESGILNPPTMEEGVEKVSAAVVPVDVAAAPMMGGRPGISGVLSRMLPGVPEDDLKSTDYNDDTQTECHSDDWIF